MFIHSPSDVQTGRNQRELRSISSRKRDSKTNPTKTTKIRILSGPMRMPAAATTKKLHQQTRHFHARKCFSVTDPHRLHRHISQRSGDPRAPGPFASLAHEGIPKEPSKQQCSSYGKNANLRLCELCALCGEIRIGPARVPRPGQWWPPPNRPAATEPPVGVFFLSTFPTTSPGSCRRQIPSCGK